MFDRNQFINWAHAARKDNTDMQDYNNSVRNPGNQLSEAEQLDELPFLVPLAIGAGVAALGYGASRAISGPSKNKAYAEAGKPAGGWEAGDSWNKGQQEKEIARKQTSGILPSTIDRHSDAYQGKDKDGEKQDVDDTPDEDKGVGKYAAQAKRRAQQKQAGRPTKESVELSEMQPHGMFGGQKKKSTRPSRPTRIAVDKEFARVNRSGKMDTMSAKKHLEKKFKITDVRIEKDKNGKAHVTYFQESVELSEIGPMGVGSALSINLASKVAGKAAAAYSKAKQVAGYVGTARKVASGAAKAYKAVPAAVKAVNTPTGAAVIGGAGYLATRGGKNQENQDKKKNKAREIVKADRMEEGIIGKAVGHGVKGFKKLPKPVRTAVKVGAGAAAVAGAGYAGTKVLQHQGRKRDRDRALGQYSSGASNPLSGRASRARFKADRAERKQEREARKAKVSEGILGTMGKAAVGGLAAYGAYKGYKAYKGGAFKGVGSGIGKALSGMASNKPGQGGFKGGSMSQKIGQAKFTGGGLMQKAGSALSGSKSDLLKSAGSKLSSLGKTSKDAGYSAWAPSKSVSPMASSKKSSGSTSVAKRAVSAGLKGLQDRAKVDPTFKARVDAAQKRVHQRRASRV